MCAHALAAIAIAGRALVIDRTALANGQIAREATTEVFAELMLRVGAIGIGTAFARHVITAAFVGGTLPLVGTALAVGQIASKAITFDTDIIRVGAIGMSTALARSATSVAIVGGALAPFLAALAVGQITSKAFKTIRADSMLVGAMEIISAFALALKASVGRTLSIACTALAIGQIASKAIFADTDIIRDGAIGIRKTFAIAAPASVGRALVIVRTTLAIGQIASKTKTFDTDIILVGTMVILHAYALAACPIVFAITGGALAPRSVVRAALTNSE